MSAYTVKQLADLAGITRRTLHYYDRIGLLRPEAVRSNGYRVYGPKALLRLQQILFYRELDLSLDEIRRLLDDPAFDTVSALEAHRRALLGRKRRLDRLIATVDDTLEMLKGESIMSDKRMFEVWSEEKEKEMEAEAAAFYGEQVHESYRVWRSYSAEQKAAILAEGEANYVEMLNHMGEGPASAAVQAAVARWAVHMRHFYTPTLEQMKAMAQMYNAEPRFHATFARLHPEFPAFLEKAILEYCRRMEQG